MNVLWNKIEGYLLGIFAILVTVACVIINFKNKKLHSLQVDLLNARYENEKNAIDAGIKEDDLSALKLKDIYERSLDLYNRTHLSK